MSAAFLEIFPDNPDKRVISKVCEFLEKGGVVICPTDTVYAFVCDLKNKTAIEKMAKLKGVKPEKANFSMLCSDLSNLAEYTLPFNNSIFRLMKNNLPGPFTFILNANSKVLKMFQNKKTIGIRVPENNIVKEIIEMLGNPLLTTSIHDDDDIIDYTSDPAILFERFSDSVEMIIDGGFGKNTPSTVIDCTQTEPYIIRQGAGIIEL